MRSRVYASARDLQILENRSYIRADNKNAIDTARVQHGRCRQIPEDGDIPDDRQIAGRWVRPRRAPPPQAAKPHRW